MEEKEERYLLDENIKNNIIENTLPYKEKSEMLDLSFYQDSFRQAYIKKLKKIINENN